MDNYLAELAKSRGELLKQIAESSFTYAYGKEKREELKAQIEQIDLMIDRVLTPKAPKATHKD